MAIIIHPYNRGSAGVSELLDAREGRGYPRFLVKVKAPPTNKKSLVVNWGVREQRYDQTPFRVLNPIDQVRLMSDKLRMFRYVGHDCKLVPQWTDAEAEARKWDGVVVARYKTAASSGDGLVIFDPELDKEFPAKAPLYTKYERKTDEFRCHTFKRKDGTFEVRLVQKKGTKLGEDGKAVGVKDWRVRNLENGFTFLKHNFETPKEVTDVAVLFMQEHFPRLDFCALDVIYHGGSKKGGVSPKALVLEGNTAPGLEGTTVDTYVSYFIDQAAQR